MEELKDYIEERLEEIEENYDFYLNKLDQTYSSLEQKQYENRLRELRIEKRTLLDVLEKIGDSDEDMVSNKEH